MSLAMFAVAGAVRLAQQAQRATALNAQLLRSVANRDSRSVRKALVAGANPNCVSRFGETPLIIAASEPDSSPVVTLLVDAGAVVDRKSRWHGPHRGSFEPTKPYTGVTPLMVAASVCNTGTLRVLLARGSDPTIRDDEGCTALSRACPDIKIIRSLLDSGADVHAIGCRGYDLMYRAAASGRADSVQLLVQRGLDVNVPQCDGSTALTGAVMTGQLNAAKVLLSHGADVGHPDKRGMTPLMWAREIRSEEMESLMVSYSRMQGTARRSARIGSSGDRPR